MDAEMSNLSGRNNMKTKSNKRRFTAAVLCLATLFAMTIGSVGVKPMVARAADCTISVTDDGNGSGSADPTSGASNVEVTLTATPNSGYQFKEWQVVTANGGTLSSTTANPAKFTIGTGDATVKAFFEQIPVTKYTVTVQTSENGSGSASPTSGATGTTVTQTATPNSGYQLKEWQVVSGGVTVSGNKFTIGTANVEVKPVFEKIPATDPTGVSI